MATLPSVGGPKETQLRELDLTQYLGLHNPGEVLVLTDSGYDDKRLQNVTLSRGWDFLTAIKKNRAAKTTKKVPTHRLCPTRWG